MPDAVAERASAGELGTEEEAKVIRRFFALTARTHRFCRQFGHRRTCLLSGDLNFRSQRKHVTVAGVP